MFTKNYRILVVDDNPAIHQDFRKILTPESSSKSLEKMNALMNVSSKESIKLPPFEIDSASNSEEAKSLVEKSLKEGKAYAVAFVDVQMPPGDDGVITVSKLWMLDPNIQIVICTAYAKYSWEDLIERFGETDSLFVLKKPFDNIEIVQLATTLAKKWNLTNRYREQLKTEKLPSTEKKIEGKSGKDTVSPLDETLSELISINDRLKEQNIKNKIKKL